MKVFGSNPTSEWTIQTIKFLLQKGLKPECLRSALVNYAGAATTSYDSKNLDLEIVKLLINHGVDINSKDLNKETALISAIRNGAVWGTPPTLATVTYLLENGANPNIKDVKGKTALDWAELKNQANIIPILQKYGAKHGNELP
jgi:ankyrin repeat protein